MGIDNKTLAAAKSYVKKSLLGAGAIKGEPGKDGKDGISVPKGGEPGQILVKKSENDYDTEWKDASVSDSDNYTMIQGIL